MRLFKPKVLLFTHALVLASVSSAVATTWFVKPDGTGDAPTIQAAIDAAMDGDTVLLATTVPLAPFGGPGNRNIDFRGKAITVKSMSGDAGSTIIDCGNVARGFVFQNGEDSTSVLSGVTIKNGFHNFTGGAIFCRSASPKIIGNVLVGNLSVGQGGAIYCDSSGAIIRHNVIQQNVAFDAGGGLWCSGRSDSLQIVGNQFVGNRAGFPIGIGGGGIACDDSNPDIKYNTFTGNMAVGSIASPAGGGAIDVSAGSSPISAGSAPIIERNRFDDNRVTNGNGGGIRYQDSPRPPLVSTITYNTFRGNEATFGGGISCESVSSPVIRNNTFDRNGAASGSGAGIYCADFSDPQIHNNIIVNSTRGNAVETVDSSSPDIRCCDFFLNFGGDEFPTGFAGGAQCELPPCGNFSRYPRFCSDGDYSLQSGSPCLPGQHPDGANCGLIGAKTVGGCVVTGIEDRTISVRYSLHQNFPNPFNPVTTIAFDVHERSENMTIKIFAVDGKLVRTLVDGQRPTGRNVVTWDGRDTSGRPVASGVYFYQLRAPRYRKTLKMVLIK